MTLMIMIKMIKARWICFCVSSFFLKQCFSFYYHNDFDIKHELYSFRRIQEFVLLLICFFKFCFLLVHVFIILAVVNIIFVVMVVVIFSFSFYVYMYAYARQVVSHIVALDKYVMSEFA